MPSLSEHKNEVVKKILEVNSKATLRKIEAILNEENEVVAVMATGGKLSKKDYIQHINAISTAIKNGGKTYSTQEVKNSILNRK